MQISLNYNEFLKLIKSGKKHIPLYTKIMGDIDSPVSLFYKLGYHKNEFSFLLESVIGGQNIGRYSFLSSSFFKMIKAKGSSIELSKNINKKWQTQKSKGDPLELLKSEIDFSDYYQPEDLPGFTGGAVGYISYDSIRYTENIPSSAKDDLDLADVLFLFTNELFIFDHADRMIRIVNVVNLEESETENSIQKKYKYAISNLEEKISLCRTALPLEAYSVLEKSNTNPISFSDNMSAADFKKTVLRCKEYINAGDIFQVVPSMRSSFPMPTSAFSLYRALRVVNPSPYMYYLHFQNLEIVGSSPEILMKHEKGKLKLRPIAGTRPRGKDSKEDKALAENLLKDPKELAEHLMLIDLGRNDLGRVCKYDSVHVDEMMVIEKYSHVMHIVSNVSGQLSSKLHPLDALRSCLPAGTLSGAPKIRAMEIIDEMEPSKRAAYGGALGNISYNGDIDMAIIIRTFIIKDNIGYIQAGAGIVYDSDPDKEYEEVKNKMEGLKKAVLIAQDNFPAL